MPVGKLNPFHPTEDDFESWVGVMDNYLIANDIDKSEASDKGTGKKKAVAVFLSSVGVSTYTLLHDLVAPDKPEAKPLDDLVKVLMEHYKPAPKALAERHKFYSRKQRHGETVNGFLAELRKLAVTCKFGDLETSLRDQFILGLLSETAQKRIFMEADDVKLAKVVSIAVGSEQAEASTLVVRGGPAASTLGEPVLKIQGGGKKPFVKSEKSSKATKGNQNQKCPNCARAHPKQQCPYKDSECHTCHRKGHLARCCRSGANNSEKGHNSKTSGSIRSVKSLRKSIPPIMINVCISGQPFSMELDTGSDTTFITEEQWKAIGKPKLQKSKSTFKTFTDEVFTAQGEFTTDVTHNGDIHPFVVAVSDTYSILGRDFLKSFQVDWKAVSVQCGHGVHMVKNRAETTGTGSLSSRECRLGVTRSTAVPNDSLNSLLQEYSDVFDKPVGVISNFKAKLILKEDASPKFYKSRPVPFAIRDKVDAELVKMEQSGAITKIQHSDWASPLVVVPKPNGKVRITGDFKRTVNSQLCVNQYPLARAEDLLESVTGGKTFSKLDGPDAYHQVELDESSKKFLVVNTHRGLYRYNVLPQGIASSPAIFQELMDRMLQGIPKSGSYIDDVITCGKTEQEHLVRLRAILQRMREYNFRLAREKCLFLQKEIPFLGHVVSAAGLSTHPKNVEAIETMPNPRNAKEVQSFLGLVNFYGKFVPHLSTICEPLYRLTREGVKFQWTKECEEAVKTTKSMITSAPVLSHFHQELPIGIACDASKHGLGVVLFHRLEDGRERPIAFASKTLSPSERNYSQIDREGLSIIYGIKRFHLFLYGRKFRLVTDHQPLLKIFGDKTALPPLVATRLHHWALFLSGYDFEIEYRNTKTHGNADALSRLPLMNKTPTDEDTDRVIKRLTRENPVTSKYVKFRSSRDKVLSVVTRYIQRGWPSHSSEVAEEIRPYYVHRNEYSIEDGTIMWGVRVVIPTALRKSVLEQLHDTHPGIVRMKSLARQHVWWPGIDKDIEATVKNCEQCCIHRDDPSAAPIHPWTFPEKPWQRLHIDLAGPFFGSMWFVLVDAHSKWPEVFRLGNNTTSSRVIECIRESCSRFGIPDTIVSDNGPQFVSEEFEQWCKQNGIRHTTSSAYHPRSNGEAERFIRTFKTSLRKEKGDNLSLCSFLLSYRVTPHASTGVSPSELLLKSSPKTLLDLMKPDPGASVRQRQEMMTEGGHVNKREFQPGMPVWVQTFSKNEAKWSRGVVVQARGPLSYEVQIGDRKMKRHVDHIVSAAASTYDTEEQAAATPVKVEPTTRPPSVVASPEFRSANTSPVVPKISPQKPIVPIPLVLEEEAAPSSRPTRVRKKPERLNISSFN